jgi:S-adenosylmethionine:tRNA ribosyltransferase-isomerase
MRTDDLDFHLPPELIAQAPAAERAASRLLHYRRNDRSIAHRTFSDLPSLLCPGDLLVFNDARVLPARFMLRKDTGGLVEGLFLNHAGERRWRVLLKNVGHHPRPMAFADEPAITASIVASYDGGEHEIEVSTDQSPAEVLGRVGRMPLPPYIKRDKGHDERDDFDRERYQTIYARTAGAVAAPTAGLHFTPAIFEALDRAGVERTFVTLHVGMGTFKPVTADTLEGHDMHSEAYSISAEAAAALNRAKREGRRIIAVGTTSARVLESQFSDQPFAEKTAETSIFIYPPYAWKHVAAMVTNFHLPRSTLIAMIAALVGLDEQRRIYSAAVEHRYRFFSYGDAMFIE